MNGLEPFALEEILQLAFREKALLKEALTHKSYAAEAELNYDNQRLEFLGDAVLQIILTKHLFHRYPKLQEGDLTKIRSALVNQTMLAKCARTFQLGDYLLLGKGEIEQNGADRDSTISDAFEALLGAIYLDQGEEAAQGFLKKVFEKVCPDPSRLLEELNPKGSLQEYTQAHFGNRAPVYKVCSVTGPQHDPTYEVEVSLEGIFQAYGKASNRKSAEQAAASQALQFLREQEKKEKE